MMLCGCIALFLKLSIFYNYNSMPAQMCMLFNVLTEIAHRRTCIQ